MCLHSHQNTKYAFLGIKHHSGLKNNIHLNFRRTACVNYGISIQRYKFLLKHSKIVTESIISSFNRVNRRLTNSSIQVEYLLNLLSTINIKQVREQEYLNFQIHHQYMSLQVTS